MDKYTVDLDQVLNDFEYSELTDQQSKSASEKPQSSTTFQPPPVTKHSINNVFHSLNEYLNSEISSNSEKATFEEQNLAYDQQNLIKNDNNLIDNTEQFYSKINEVSNNVTSTLNETGNNLQSLDSTVEILGQNERLLKLKNDPQIVDLSEKDEANFQQIKDKEVPEKLQLDNLEKVTENLNLLIQDSDTIKTLSEPANAGSIINTDSHDIQQNICINSGPLLEKNNENLYKTDENSFSLLDTENIETELIPGLNCTENNITNEFESVNNDKDCDKNVDNKADNELNKQINFVKKIESFSRLNESKTEGIEDIIVNNTKVNEKRDVLLEKIENTNDITSDNVDNVAENIENFVIEPSKDSESDKDISTTKEISFVGNDTAGYGESAPNLESTEEPCVESNEKIQQNTTEPTSNESTLQINENTDERLLTHSDLTVNQESLLTEGSNLEGTTTSVAENSSECIKDESENTEQKILVGFSADIDIDDSELHKMLEELEIEESDDLDINLTTEDSLKKTEGSLIGNQEFKVEMTDNENVGEQRLVLEDPVSERSSVGVSVVKSEEKEPQSLNTKIITNSQGEILLEKPEDIKHIEENSYKTKDSIKTQPIECLEVEKSSKSKKDSSKNMQNTETPQNDISKTADTLQEESNISGQSMESTETPPQQQQNVDEPENTQLEDSLSRPQDLPLHTKLTDENVTRKIDLIGSPGSTPYNNVYINKSIEPKAAHDTDSDYTSSASPTFSDCSTDSTSTASTASVEDVPKNTESATNVSKNSAHKNKHSDKSATKNKGSGEGAQGDGDLGDSERESNVQERSDDRSEHTQNTEEAARDNKESTNTEQSGDIISNPTGGNTQEARSQPTETFLDKSWLGKEAPLWIPDSDAAACLHCDMKFTVLKRRHHCRACGLVLCSKCCNLKFKLEYLDAEARVCTKCHNILNKDNTNPTESGHASESGDSPAFRPNPNNPLEYCSTVSPLQQMGSGGAPPPSVMVPVGVLKRQGSNKKSNKSVMFCDGIAPGSDLTNLDQDFNYNSENKIQKSPPKVVEEVKKKDEPPPVVPAVKTSRNQAKIDEDTKCFIPKSETSLPPTVCVNKTDILYSECSNSPSVVEMLKNEVLTFAINQNLFVEVKVINMNCCINKYAWCFSTDGLINVGSDEIVYLIEYIDEESFVPKDVFFHIQNVYLDALKGTSIKEQGLSLHNTSNFLDSKNHAGFVYIRPTFQCLENVIKPKEPYLIGILIHRWETPWAKLFPLRLILRLGAEYRYYPSPLISTRHRDSVFVEIGHTIINLLADFRNFTYTLPQIRGLIIHMEDKKTTITIPKNRYDQVMKSINNSSEHILAFAGNFSPDADSHLVCIQDTQGHENSYTTHAINIHNKPRKITGASFLVFNGSLKSSSGLTAKSNIVEDGLMIQIPSEHMDKIRDNLRNMKDHTIACGCVNATTDDKETVNIVWGDNDIEFNGGVQSPVDLSDMRGVPSIRVHNGKDYFCNNGTRLIRWTEVFILQNSEENSKNQDPVDVSKVSESVAKACCTALVKYLDLLVSNSCQKIAIRTTLHIENVSYSAGSNGLKLPPIYMRSLDNELIPVLHRITSNNLGDNAIVLELIFRILNA